MTFRLSMRKWLPPHRWMSIGLSVLTVVLCGVSGEPADADNTSVHNDLKAIYREADYKPIFPR